MRRRDFNTLLCGAAAAWPLAAHGQHSERPYRVAYLALLAGLDSAVVQQRLQELGYTEGNMIFDYRSAEGQSERLPDLAAELVRTEPDVLIAGFGTLTAKAAQAATASIPIVFASVGDPIGAGIVKSLNRPGANVTGLSSEAAEISGKRLQILEELVPGIRTVGVLMNPETPFTLLALRELRTAADARGQSLKISEMRTADQLSTSIEASVKAGAPALIILEDPLLLNLRRQIADLATKLRLPIIYANRQFVEAGGLLSYGPDRRQLFRRAAELVDKILKGTKPADIPVEQPTKFELVINVRVAKALGLTIPPTLLAQADEVIE